MLVDENMTHIYFKDDNIFANDINVWNITSSMNLLSIGLIGESFKLIHFLIPGHDMGSVFPIFFFFCKCPRNGPFVHAQSRLQS